VLDRTAVRRSGRDLRQLVLPTRRRALVLDKAYLTLVEAQNFIDGRDANVAPDINVFRRLENKATALQASKRVYKDGRLWLAWPTVATASGTPRTGGIGKR